MKRILVFAALAVFLAASAALALARGATSPADQPVQRTSQPAPGLQLTVSLDHSRLSAGVSLHLQVELKNTGAAPVAIPQTFCIVPLRTAIVDAGGRTVWSQPIPMIACPAMYPPRQVLLNPGQSLQATMCWAVGPGGASKGCSTVDLTSGSYRVTGTYEGFAFQELPFDVR
jgi:hypothetical protein